MKEARLFIIILALFFLFVFGVMVNPESQEPVVMEPETFALTSLVFNNGEPIPERYSCDGENISPELRITGVPEGTKSMVLVVDDPDIPQVFKDERGIDSFDHWVMYGIEPTVRVIPEGGVVGATGLNGRGAESYTGPCPPADLEPTTHRYIFKLYALSGTLNFIKAPTKAEVLSAIEPMVIDTAELIGTYDRSK